MEKSKKELKFERNNKYLGHLVQILIASVAGFGFLVFGVEESAMVVAFQFVMIVTMILSFILAIFVMIDNEKLINS